MLSPLSATHPLEPFRTHLLSAALISISTYPSLARLLAITPLSLVALVLRVLLSAALHSFRSRRSLVLAPLAQACLLTRNLDTALSLVDIKITDLSSVRTTQSSVLLPRVCLPILSHLNFYPPSVWYSSSQHPSPIPDNSLTSHYGFSLTESPQIQRLPWLPLPCRTGVYRVEAVERGEGDVADREFLFSAAGLGVCLDGVRRSLFLASLGLPCLHKLPRNLRSPEPAQNAKSDKPKQATQFVADDKTLTILTPTGSLRTGNERQCDPDCGA